MRSFQKLFSLLLMVLFALSLTVTAVQVKAEEFFPPVPDKRNTLPADDGGADGCDSSRFKCVMDGNAVLDKQTGLIWAKKAEFDQKPMPWDEAVKLCERFDIGGKKGWRLPTRDEFISLLDTSQSNPALPPGHPFILKEVDHYGGTGTQSYWTSTENKENDKSAWTIRIRLGKVTDNLKLFDSKVWPVRDYE